MPDKNVTASVFLEAIPVMPFYPIEKKVLGPLPFGPVPTPVDAVVNGNNPGLVKIYNENSDVSFSVTTRTHEPEGRPYPGNDPVPLPPYDQGDIWPLHNIREFRDIRDATIHETAPTQPGMPYPGPGQETSFVSMIDHTPIDEFGNPYVTSIREAFHNEGKPYDDGTSKLPPIVYGPGGVAPEEDPYDGHPYGDDGALFPLTGTHIPLYDPGFTVYIDAEGNTVCGYPPLYVPPEGPVVPVTEFPSSPVIDTGFTVYDNGNGVAVCGPAIPDPVQTAIDAFVNNGGEKETVVGGGDIIGNTGPIFLQYEIFTPVTNENA